MGSILSAIRDDEDEYYDLCQRYGEPSQPGGPYNAHCNALKKRAREEWEDKNKASFMAAVAPKPKAPPKPKPPIRRTVADRILETIDDD